MCAACRERNISKLDIHMIAKNLHFAIKLFGFVPFFSLARSFSLSDTKQGQKKIVRKLNGTIMLSRQHCIMCWFIQSKIGNVIGFVKFEQCHTAVAVAHRSSAMFKLIHAASVYTFAQVVGNIYWEQNVQQTKTNRKKCATTKSTYSNTMWVVCLTNRPSHTHRHTAITVTVSQHAEKRENAIKDTKFNKKKRARENERTSSNNA